MIIHALHFNNKDLSDSGDELDVLERQRRQLLKRLPKMIRDERIVEKIALSICRVLQTHIKEIIGNPNTLFSARIIRKKREEITLLLEDPVTCQTIFEEIDCIQPYSGREPTTREKKMLRKIWEEIFPLYIRSFLLHELEELNMLLEEREEEEREWMIRYNPPQENQHLKLEDPRQQNLFDL